MERKLFLFFAIFTTIIIGWGSLITIENAIPSDINISDKAIHLTAYLILTLCWLIAVANRFKVLNISIFVVLLVFFYGIIIEVLQKVITNYRQFDFFDILANLVGIIIAFILFFIVSKKKCIK